MAHEAAMRLADLIECGLRAPNIVEKRSRYIVEGFKIDCCVIGMAFVATYIEQTGSTVGVGNKFWECIDMVESSTRSQFDSLGEYIGVPKDLLYAVELEHLTKIVTASEIVVLLRVGEYDSVCETKEVV